MLPARSNARHGHDPGLSLYTHLSDQHGPYSEWQRMVGHTLKPRLGIDIRVEKTLLWSQMPQPLPETDSYKRGQAVGALWHAFSGPHRLMNPVVPSTFVRRVVKFIELGVGWSGERPGSGTDIGFDLADVFEIGIALDLQDMGLNQLEVALFVRRHRPPLCAALAKIDWTAGQGSPVFMVVRARAATEPVRYTEDLSTLSFSRKQQISWYEPEFIEGGESVGKRLEQLGGRDRKRLVIEIRDLALSLAHYLPLMPVRKRGRR